MECVEVELPAVQCVPVLNAHQQYFGAYRQKQKGFNASKPAVAGGSATPTRIWRRF